MKQKRVRAGFPVLRVGVELCHLLEGRSGLVFALLSLDVVCNIFDDGHQEPGCFVLLRLVDFAQAADDPDEGFLHGVLCQMLVPKDILRRVFEAAFILVKKALKFIAVLLRVNHGKINRKHAPNPLAA